MYKNYRIAVLMPAYNEAPRIGPVLSSVPAFVDYIVIVNDGSTDGTVCTIKSHIKHNYLLIDWSQNKGPGAALAEAHEVALSQTDADIMVTMDSDGQMDPIRLPSILDPLVNGECDYTKGNRFFSANSFSGMPKYRIFGNVILTFLTKIASGYWSIFDPENGYTAITREVSEQIDWKSLNAGWAWPNDVLFRLSIARARVKDVNIPAKYGAEVSAIKLRYAIPALIVVLWSAFWKRLWVRYVLQSFSPLILLGLVGTLFFVFGLLFGLYSLWQAKGAPVVPAASAVLVAVTTISGIQLLLAALVLDILSEPR